MHPDNQILHGYVDQELAPEARADVEQHLEHCPECRDLVDDLVALCATARTLPPLQPPANAWSDISLRVRAASRPAVSRAATRWLGIAAAVLLIVSLGGLGWLLTVRRQPHIDPAAVDLASVESELQAAEVHYQNAIEGLQSIASSESDRLDPQTAETLRTNLAVVDRAIAESRAALASRPDSALAKVSLLEGLRSKLALLEDTVATINQTRSKG